jgi:predicted nucleotidyltransferase
MPIPEFVDNVLPEGIHDCTFEEVKERFGRFQNSARRIDLTEKLERYLKVAKASGIVVAVIIDGSYATGKDEPEDIDLIAVLAPEFEWSQELRPFQYNAVGKRAVKRDYKFDLRSEKDGTRAMAEYVEFFSSTADKHKEFTSQSRKGMVRVSL